MLQAGGGTAQTSQEGTSRSSLGMPESWRANKWLSILFANRIPADQAKGYQGLGSLKTS